MVSKKKPPHERRVDIYLDMPDPTRELALETQQVLVNLALRTTLAHYHLGEHIRAIHQDEPKFGAAAVEHLANFLAIPGGAGFLYRLSQVVRKFTRKFVKDQASKPLANGRPFEIGHFVALVQVRSRRERERLILQVRSEGLTVKQLEKRVRELNAALRA